MLADMCMCVFAGAPLSAETAPRALRVSRRRCRGQAVAKQMFGRDAIELRDMDHIAEKADRNSQDGGGAAARVTARHLLAEFTDEEKVKRISEAAQLTFRLTRVLVE